MPLSGSSSRLPSLHWQQKSGTSSTEMFCNCRHFTRWARVFFCVFKTEEYTITTLGPLWAQDSTQFALYNLWHFYGSPFKLAQSRENESVEEKEKRGTWVYPCAAVTQWGAKSWGSLFCLNQTLLLRTHLFSIFTKSVLLVLTFCILKI